MLKKCVIACLLCAFVFGYAGGVFAATTIKVAINVPSEHHLAQAQQWFKKQIEDRTNGAFKVECIDSFKFGNHEALVQGLQMGVLAMIFETTSLLSVYSPTLMLFDLPYLIPSWEAADLIIDGPVGAKMAKDLERLGLVPMGYVENGFRQIISSRPVRKLEDNKGLKIRSTPSKIHIASLKSIQANPTPLAWPEVTTALQQKTVDGVDIDVNMGWYFRFVDYAKFITMSRHIYTPLNVVYSKKFWDALTPEHKKIFEEVTAAMIKEQRKVVRQGEVTFRERMIKEMGVEFIDLSPEELARWAEKACDVGMEFKNTVPLPAAQEIVNAIEAAGLYPKGWPICRFVK